jgi:hypothetical protein
VTNAKPDQPCATASTPDLNSASTAFSLLDARNVHTDEARARGGSAGRGRVGWQHKDFASPRHPHVVRFTLEGEGQEADRRESAPKRIIAKLGRRDPPEDYLAEVDRRRKIGCSGNRSPTRSGANLPGVRARMPGTATIG